MILRNEHFKKLDETVIMVLGYVFESAYVVDKITKEEFGIFQFDNDPTCGLLDRKNDWCLVGGDILVLKTWFDKGLRAFGNLRDIHSLKRIDDNTINILTDPWSKESSIWQLRIDINTPTNPTNLMKLKDFHDYFHKPYTEQVLW